MKLENYKNNRGKRMDGIWAVGGVGLTSETNFLSGGGRRILYNNQTKNINFIFRCSIMHTVSGFSITKFVKNLFKILYYKQKDFLKIL